MIVAKRAKNAEACFAVDDGRAFYGDLGSEDEASQRPSGTQDIANKRKTRYRRVESRVKRREEHKYRDRGRYEIQSRVEHKV